MSSNKFKIEVPDWTKINIDNAKFILEEAKSYVKYLSYASDKITNRAFAILTILIPITSALIIFIVNEKYKPVLNNNAIFHLLFFDIVALVAIMFGLSKIVFPRMFMPLGREPKVICIKEFLGIEFDEQLAKLSIVLNEIEASQVKIDYNETQNGDRTKLLKSLMLAIGFLFIVSIAIIGYVVFVV